MEALHLLARNLVWQPYRARQARAVLGEPPPGINEIAAGALTSAPMSENWTVHPLDLDAQPALTARHAWFDFFRPDYEWVGHFDRGWQPDSD